MNDKEESAINQIKEEPVDLVSEQWKDWDLRKLMNMMVEEDVSYFDGEENPATDIKTLVKLAGSKELLVERDAEGRRVLMKKASINNQIVIPRSAREVVMKYAHMHHRGVSTTLQEIKRRCYWPNCTLDVAQMIRRCSVCLEKHRVDLHDGEAFDRSTTKV